MNKKLLISALLLFTSSTVLPAQSSYRISENLLSENPTVSIDNGKQGSQLFEFSPKNVRC